MFSIMISNSARRFKRKSLDNVLISEPRQDGRERSQTPTACSKGAVKLSTGFQNDSLSARYIPRSHGALVTIEDGDDNIYDYPESENFNSKAFGRDDACGNTDDDDEYEIPIERYMNMNH